MTTKGHIWNVWMHQRAKYGGIYQGGRKKGQLMPVDYMDLSWGDRQALKALVVCQIIEEAWPSG